jgi:acetyl-CoA C-acetyltransferase/acetyl-CoA acyltransferase
MKNPSILMTSTQPIFIVAGLRTPFCKAGTELAELTADELGRIVVSQLLARTGLDPARIDEVIAGCVAQPPEAANLARVIALRAGIPARVPAVTVHRNCASGFEAIATACDRIEAGRGEAYIAVGVESMSNAPLLFPSRAGRKFADFGRAKTLASRLRAALRFRPSDFAPRPALRLGLTDPVCGLNMGETAEWLARDFAISREEQDAFALESHRRAAAAGGRLKDEMCPVFLPRSPKRKFIREDNGVRSDCSAQALARLDPAFEKPCGTVTPGNASQVSDGAVALLVATERIVADLGIEPLGRVTAHASTGCDPVRMGLGPVFAIDALSPRLHLEEADLIEINEAFAAQTLAVLRALESDAFAREALGRKHAVGSVARERLNVNGGAIAIGHPVGASGARLVLTSLLELRRRKGRRAIVAACVGGGQGAALWLERNGAK